MAEEITFKLRAISDFKDITSNIDALRKKFQELKMPTDTYKGFDKTFTALEAKITSAQEKLKNGFKNGSEVNSFKRDLSDIKQLYSQIGKELKGIDVSEVFKGIDSPELVEARQRLLELENQLKQLTNAEPFAKLTASADELKDALGRDARKEVKGFIEDLQGGKIDAAARKIRELQQAVAKMAEGKTKAAYTNFLQQIGLDPSQAGATLDQIKQKLMQTFNGEELNKTKQGIDEWQTKIASLEFSKIEDFDQALKQIFSEFNKTNQSMGTFQHNMDDLTDSQKRLNSELDQFKNRIGYFFGINNAVRLFQRALRSAYETVKDLDKVMTETAVVTDFTVSDMWEQLPEYTARANELGLAIHDVYEASTLYYQQGLKTNEVMAVTNATLRMARIAGLDAAEATDRVTNALRGFNMEITEANANNIADVYSKLAAMSASNVDEISTAMTKVASLANNANMEFETTAAFLAQIIETTRESAETAGTALKTVVARFSEVKKLYSEGELLGNDEEGQEIDVNKVSTALRTAGINLNEFLTGQRGLDEIFMELASKWDSLTIVQQRYIATMAAGSRQQSRFIALMSDYARTQELVAAAQDASGASQAQYEKTLDSLETKLNQLKNAWDEFVMGLAKDEAIKWVVDALTDLIGVINKLTSGLPGILKTVSRIGIAFGAFKLGKAVFNDIFKNIGTQLGTRATKAGEEAGSLFSSGFKKTWQKLWPQAVQIEQGTLKNNFQQMADKIFGSNSLAKQKLEDLLANPETADAEARLRSLGNELGRAEEEMDPLVDSFKQYQNSMTESYVKQQKFSAGMQQFGTVAAGAGAALLGVSQILGILGFDKAAETTQKFGTVLLSLGMIIPLVTKAVVWLGTESFLAGLKAQMGWLPFTGIVLAIAAAIGGLVYGFVQLEKSMHPAREQLKAVNEALNTVQDQADAAKQAVEDLESTWDSLTEARNNLDGLTRGTQEWREALYEVNQQVLELIEKYPELAAYVVRGENGGLSFEEEGYKRFLQEERRATERLAQTQLGLQAIQRQAQGQVESDRVYNQRQGQAIASGALLGLTPLLGPLGLIGGIAGLNASGGLSRDEWRELLVQMQQSGFSAQTISSEDLRNLLNNEIGADLNDAQLNSVYSQIQRLGSEFDSLSLEAIETQIAVDQSIDALVLSIESSSDVIDETNSSIVGAGLQLVNDTEKFQTEYQNQLKALRGTNRRDLREIYAEEVGGYYNNGKLYTDNSATEEIKLDANALREAIANARATEEFSTAIKTTIAELSNIQDETLLRLLRGISSNEELTEISGDSEKISAWAQDYGLSEDAINQYISTLLSEFDSVDIEIQRLNLPVKIANHISQAFDEAEATNEEKKAFTNILKELLSDASLSEEDKEKFYEQLGLTDFGSIQSIKQLVDIISELPTASNFTSEQLDRLQNSAIEAADAVSKINFTTLVNNVQALQEQINKGERVFTKERMEQLISFGLSEDQFSRRGEDEFTYIGDMNQLQGVLDQEILNEFETAVGNVQSANEKLAQANSRVAEATEDAANKRERINELNNGLIPGFQPAGDYANPNLNPIINYNVPASEIEGIEEAVDNIDASWANTQNIQPSELDLSGLEQQLAEATTELTRAEEEETAARQSAGEAGASQAAAEAVLRDLISQYGQTASMSSLIPAMNELDLTSGENEQVVNNALIARAAQYEDLIDLVDALKQAETQEAKTEARLALMAELAAKDRQKAYEDLFKLMKDNEDTLSNPGTRDYERALASIVSSAREVFGDNENITTQFVEENLDAFKALAEGSESAVETIRLGLLNNLTESNQQLQGLSEMMADMSNNPLEIAGHFDASEIFTMLAAVLQDTEKAAEFMRILGYSVTWVPTDEEIWTGVLPNGDTFQMPYQNYKAEVVDGFGNAAETVRASGGSGGGGGGGGSKKTWKNPYDELYNLTEDINENLRERNHLEDEYGRIVDRNNKEVTAAYKNNLQARENLYQERRYRDQELAGRRNQLSNIGNRTVETEDGLKTYTEMDVVKYARYNDADNTVEIDWDGIDKIEDTEIGKAVEQYVKDLEELQGQIEDTEDRIIEIDDDLWELEQRGKEEALDMEKRLAEALKNQQQKVIDEYQALSETIDNTNNRILDGLQESIDLSRQIRDNTKTEEDIAQKEARLAYLRRDTSGANALEIQQLQKELDEARQSYSDTLIDQSIDRLSQDNQKAADQRAQQIDIMQSQLDYAEEIGEFNRQAEQMLIDAVMNEDFSEIEAILKADERFDAMSSFAQGQWTDEFRSAVVQAYEGAMNFLQLGSKPTLDMTLSQLGNGINSAIQQANRSSGSGGGSGSPPPGNTGDTGRDQEKDKIKGGYDEDAMRAYDFAEARRLYNSTGNSAIQQEILNTQIDKLNKKWNLNLAKVPKSLNAYKTGGLADFTGPAWLDGTKSHPELVLNAKDTENFIALRNILSHLMNGQVGGAGASASGDINLDIDINVDQIANDYDVDRLVDRVKQNIYQDASYRNINQINFIR